MGIVRGAIVREEDDNCPEVIFRGATVLGGNCSVGGNCLVPFMVDFSLVTL